MKIGILMSVSLDADGDAEAGRSVFDLAEGVWFATGLLRVSGLHL